MSNRGIIVRRMCRPSDERTQLFTQHVPSTPVQLFTGFQLHLVPTLCVSIQHHVLLARRKQPNSFPRRDVHESRVRSRCERVQTMIFKDVLNRRAQSLRRGFVFRKMSLAERVH
jgi:hypothetical protein